jgi:DUF1009 family protein
MLDNKYLTEKIAIIAGRGLLPKILIDDCQKRGQEFLLFLLDSEQYEIDYSKFNPIILPYGGISKILEIIKSSQIENLVLVGAVNKPNFTTIKVDKKGALLVSKILTKKILGDNSVLQTVIDFFEKEGLKILTIDQLLSDIVSKEGVLTKLAPNNDDLENIKIATNAIKTMSYLDIGQSVIMAQKQIIAVEALEGTDNLIKRCGELNAEFKKDAILVKLKKTGQTKKADLPVIGLDTIKNCHDSGIKGIAIESGATLIINKEQVIKAADELGLFIISIKRPKISNFSFLKHCL